MYPEVVSPVSIFKVVYFCYGRLKLILQILNTICILVCSGECGVQLVFHDFYAVAAVSTVSVEGLLPLEKVSAPPRCDRSGIL